MSESRDVDDEGIHSEGVHSIPVVQFEWIVVASPSRFKIISIIVIIINVATSATTSAALKNEIHLAKYTHAFFTRPATGPGPTPHPGEQSRRTHTTRFVVSWPPVVSQWSSPPNNSVAHRNLTNTGQGEKRGFN